MAEVRQIRLCLLTYNLSLALLLAMEAAGSPLIAPNGTRLQTFWRFSSQNPLNKR